MSITSQKLNLIDYSAAVIEVERNLFGFIPTFLDIEDTNLGNSHLSLVILVLWNLCPPSFPLQILFLKKTFRIPLIEVKLKKHCLMKALRWIPLFWRQIACLCHFPTSCNWIPNCPRAPLKSLGIQKVGQLFLY